MYGADGSKNGVAALLKKKLTVSFDMNAGVLAGVKQVFDDIEPYALAAQPEPAPSAALAPGGAAVILVHQKRRRN